MVVSNYIRDDEILYPLLRFDGDRGFPIQHFYDDISVSLERMPLQIRKQIRLLFDQRTGQAYWSSTYFDNCYLRQ